MTSVMPITSNAVELHVMAINEKPWTVARGVYIALKYSKQTTDITKAFYGQENYAHKYQIIKLPAVGYLVDWPKGFKKVGLLNQ